MRAFYVYILASARNGTLYIGVTNDLIRRVWEHREGLGSKFCKKHGVSMLVHFETFETVDAAINRERRLKRYLRKWKLELIERNNPQWRDLYDEVASGWLGPQI